MEDTIVAPATPLGKGGVSVVRVSGVGAKAVGEVVCGELNRPWVFKKCQIKNKKGVVVDSGLVVLFESPKSYTGEDVVEVHCHGSPVVVDLVVESFLSAGCRLAEPGEFTKRAYLNEKIDMTQAEAVSDLIASETEEAARAAHNSLVGEFSKLVNGVIDRVVSVRVLVESSIDFSDEDGVVFDKEARSSLIPSIQKEVDSLEFLVESSKEGARLREGIKISLIGPPNSGKSTLLNLLSKEDVAIVSDMPGTTRDVLRVKLNLGGILCEFSDTAGIRDSSSDPIEKEGMKRAAKEAGLSDLILLISSPNEGVDFDTKGVPFLRVVNKVDLIDSKEIPGVYISSLTGEGIEDLKASILNSVGFSGGVEVPVLARRRHVFYLEKALKNLKRSVDLANEGAGLELIAEELVSAHSELGNIAKPMSSDDLLGEIFSEFCIGK